MIGDLNTFELMFLRSLIGLVLVLGFGIAMGRLAEARTRRLPLHAMRNVFHFSAQNLWFYAVAYIPLAQLFAIEFTTPIWIALLAPLLLGERMTAWRIVSAILGFAGIMIIAQPGTSELTTGHLTAALSTIGFAGSIMMTKALSRTESIFTILFWLTVTQAIYGGAIVLWDGQMTLPLGWDIFWVIVVGVGGLTAHICLTTALGLAPASVVAPMDFARLPLIAAIGALVYDERIGLAVAAGAVLILFANGLNIAAENRRSKQQETPV